MVEIPVSYIEEYMHLWFPKLPSYQAFNNRLNRLSEAFRTLAIRLFTRYIPKDGDLTISLTDSMLIVTCKGKNKRKRWQGKWWTRVQSGAE